LIWWDLNRRPNSSNVQIKIISPKNYDTVERSLKVYGSINPPGNPVQILIFSNNQKWYPQKTANVDGNDWNADCCFGNDNTKSGQQFTIVAMSGINPIREEISQLPQLSDKSHPVIVFRK
jgi:hypothetical protein